MTHVRNRKVAAPLLFILATIAAAYVFIGLEQGNRDGTVYAILLTLFLAGLGYYEAKRPIELTDEEKRRMDWKP